jgi:hypothetical protein
MKELSGPEGALGMGTKQIATLLGGFRFAANSLI